MDLTCIATDAPKDEITKESPMMRHLLLAAATAVWACNVSSAFAQSWNVTAEPRTLGSGATVCVLLYNNSFDIHVYESTAFLVVQSEDFITVTRRQVVADVKFPSGASGRYVLLKQDEAENMIRLYPPTLEDLYTVLDQFDRDGELSVSVLGRTVRIALPDASSQVASLKVCMAQLDLD